MDPRTAVLISRLANLLAIVGLLLVLTGSLYLQFSVGEQPCPLCLVQRSGMIGLAVGPLLNLLWGIRARNYAISILAAFTGGAGSVRQVFLHIANPLDPGYGPAVFGWHLYTWAAVTFVIGVIGCALLLMWETPLKADDRGLLREGSRLTVAAVAAFTWVSIYLGVIAVSVVPECGLGLCPDDPDPINGIPGWAFGLALLGVAAISLAAGALVSRRRSD
jgi:disulfide bond formation protein DsbB